MLTVITAMSAVLLVHLTKTGESFTFMMGHFPAPWGNELRAGPLEALLALCFCVVMAFSIIGGSRNIFEDILPEKQNLYFIMMNLLMSSLLALIYTNDIFTAYVFIEINTIAACAIVAAKDNSETLVATVRYLVMSLLGSGLFLISIAILYDITGHLLMSNIQQQVLKLVDTGDYLLPLTIVFGLMVLGIALKSALFPFHAWLPDAHGSATTSSSAVLSGLVLKGYIVLLIKVCYRVFTLDIISSFHVGNLLFFFGVSAMIVGSVLAIREGHIKRMIAYSSVAQIGYIYMGIGLCSDAGMVAACFHILAHAFTKAMLFVCAGGLTDEAHHNKQIYYLKGTAYKNRLAGIGFTIGALSMIGIPLFAGFVSKLYFATASMFTGPRMVITMLVLAISSVLNALYYIPAVIAIWTPSVSEDTLDTTEEKESEGIRGPGVAFVVSSLVFIVANFVLGIFYQPIIEIIEQGIALL